MATLAELLILKEETGSTNDDLKALVASGVGQPFAPAGRVFREWVAVSVEHRDAWSGLLEEGMARAEGS